VLNVEGDGRDDAGGVRAALLRGGGDEETTKCGIEQRKREWGSIYGGGAFGPG